MCLARASQCALRQTNVQTTIRRQCADRIWFERRFGQIGQTFGQLELLPLRLIKPQQTNQLLPARGRLVLGRRQAGSGIGIERLLTGTTDAVEVAYRLHAPREFGTCLGAFKHLSRVAQGLLSRHGTHPGLAYLRHAIHHLSRKTQLRLLDAALGDARAGRQGQEIQQTKRERARQLQLITNHHALKTEDGVGNAADLCGVGGLRPTLRQQGLQGVAVGQCELHSFFLPKGFCQQLGSELCALLTFLIALGQAQLPVSEAGGLGIDAVHVLLEADAGTARQNPDSNHGHRQLGAMR